MKMFIDNENIKDEKFEEVFGQLINGFSSYLTLLLIYLIKNDAIELKKNVNLESEEIKSSLFAFCKAEDCCTIEDGKEITLGEMWRSKGDEDVFNKVLLIEDKTIYDFAKIVEDYYNSLDYELAFYEVTNHIEAVVLYDFIVLHKDDFNNCLSLLFDEILRKLYTDASNGLYVYKDYISESIPGQGICLHMLNDHYVSVSKLFVNGGVLSVYNPFSCLIDFRLFNKLGQKIYVHAGNELALALNKMYMSVNEQSCYYFQQGNPVDNWIADKKFDLILSNPDSYNTPIDNDKYNFNVPSLNCIKSIENACCVLKNSFGSLTEKGQLILTTFIDLLYRRRDSIKPYVDKGILKAIVYLPIEQEVTTFDVLGFDCRKSLERVMLIIDKGHSIEEGVRLYDGRQTTSIDELERLIDCNDPSITKDVPVEKILSFNYNLNPESFFGDINIVKGFELLPLSCFLYGFEPKKIECEHVHEVTPAYLSRDNAGLIREYKDFPEGVEKQNKGYIDNLLLVSSVSGLHPTYYKSSQGESISTSPRVFAYKFNGDDIFPLYLVLELTKGYVKKQIDSKSQLNGRPYVMMYGINILVPIHRQDSKDIYYSEMNKLQSSAIDDLHKQIDDKQGVYQKNIRMRKHALGQILNQFSPAFSMLEKCKREHDGELKDSFIVANRTGENVADYFNKLNFYLSKMEVMVNSLTDDRSYGNKDYLPLEGFIKDYCNNHKSSKFKFQLALNNIASYDIILPGFSRQNFFHITGSEIATQGRPDIVLCKKGEECDFLRVLFINEGDLMQVFDNIVSNAVNWGFTDRNRDDYVIKIEISTEDDDAIINISNNGVDLPSGIDSNNFFDWGVGCHTGLGTWQIRNIIEHYGGAVNLVHSSNEPSGFMINYRIVMRNELLVAMGDADLSVLEKVINNKYKKYE
jgi:hypothetical protein